MRKLVYYGHTVGSEEDRLPMGKLLTGC